MSDKYFFEYHIINILDVIKAVDAWVFSYIGGSWVMEKDCFL